MKTNNMTVISSEKQNQKHIVHLGITSETAI